MLSRMQAKGLSAGYNGEAVFRGLDLKIPEGSITTLIGSNGSGKSTILKTLCRIISPDSGAVYLDGEAIHEMPTKRVAQRLFLDEPTTYLDISHQLDILYLLRRLNRENGVTIVMVLHDLNHAIMFSDYLVAIKDGTLHSAGTPQEVITRQALREIFDVEAEVITHPVLNVPVCLPFRITEQNKKTGGSNT